MYRWKYSDWATSAEILIPWQPYRTAYFPRCPVHKCPRRAPFALNRFPTRLFALNGYVTTLGYRPQLLAASSAAISPIPLAMIFGPWCYLTLVRAPYVIPLRPAASVLVRIP